MNTDTTSTAKKESTFEALNEEALRTLVISRRHADEGKYRDADAISRDMKMKYGL